MIYLQLAFEFFKAGLFAVGGGLATLPFLMQTAQTYPQWYTIDELMQMVAISQSTPGPIGVNMANYVGFHVAGIPGAAVATFALILPAFITILIVVHVLDRFQSNHRIAGGMEAMRPAVTGLIAAAGYAVLRSVLFSVQGDVTSIRWIALVIFAGLFFSLRVKQLSRLHPIVYIVIGAILGIVLEL